MTKGQKMSVNGVELFLCPFTDLRITQLSDTGSHLGTKAIDVNGKNPNEKVPYYAPATVQCTYIYEPDGLYMWTTVNPVRLANGYVGKVSFMCNHDNNGNHYVGQIIKQGELLGHTGDKWGGQGKINSHCHYEMGYGYQNNIHKNQYGIYCMYDEVYVTDAWFMDNTNIMNYLDAGWKTTNNLFYNKSVDRDETKDQIKVFTNKYYPTARKEPKVDGYLLGFVKEGIYNILETKIVDNITWFKIDNEVWFDYGKEWCEVLNKDNNEELKREIDNLRTKLDTATKELDKYKKIVEKVKELVKD